MHTQTHISSSHTQHSTLNYYKWCDDDDDNDDSTMVALLPLPKIDFWENFHTNQNQTQHLNSCGFIV